MKFRIMVVDDHAIVLHGLTQLINSSTDLEVTMQAQSAESALANTHRATSELTDFDLIDA
jgi:DNA-binding NarL/FixJ family response regulator